MFDSEKKSKTTLNDTVLKNNVKQIKKHKKVRLKLYELLLNLNYYKFSYLIIIAIILIGFIENVNCNRPPRFIIDGHTPEIVLRLKESPETPVGTLIYQLKGYDPDDDPLTFNVLPSIDSDIIQIIPVNKNQANIYLAKELDRETKDEYSIVLTLTDNQFENDNYVTQSLLLVVEDINDNAPIFNAYQSAIEVPEDSKPPGIITTLEATDRDEGAYGQVVYYLQELDGDNDIFSITTRHGKGVIKLIKNLDYEKKSLYQLRVLAVDRANQRPINTGTAAILVKVKDVEDQPPEFIQIPPITRVPESIEPGTDILHVKAIDGDRGINNKIKYFIEKKSNNDLFEIDENTGIVYTIKELDREDTRNQIDGAYILIIIAIEETRINPPPYAKTEATIIITDVNDETPKFREQQYRCEINENAQINTPLTFIDRDVRNEVYDYDAGNNGTFRLYLDPPNEIFEISPNLGVNEATFLIRVKDPKMLDYEKIVEMNFTIVAREIEEPKKWSTANVQIMIRDQNDNFPEFMTNIYEVTIPENCDIGTTIVQIEAFDDDSGDFGTMGIRYTNLRGSIANLLALDPITGVITVIGNDGNSFDREIISRHYLTVEARDFIGRGNRNTVQLIINIDDVNDNPPIFLQNRYEAKLLENKINFETPLIIEAHDADLNNTANSEISYEIVEGQLKNNFTIDSKNGVLTPKTPIDFEELTDGFSNIRSIQLMVKARDYGIPYLFSKISIIIYVQDVNDNPPIFQKKFYNKTISEDLSGNSPVLQVTAIDIDGSSPNNHVVYRIQSGASDKFIIDADTGIIFVAKGASLDPDLTNPKRTLYSLTVVALDGGLGETQLTATTFVNITIKDVNNKPPILKETGVIRIQENTPVGTFIYQLIAIDLDESPILRYQLDKKNSDARTEEGAFVKQTEYDYVKAFELNPLNGMLKIAHLLDRERVEQIKLGVIVQDLAAAKGTQIAISSLNIIIEDVNDNNPKFKMPYYKKSITENSMNGVTIVNVVAFDIDKNKTITYSLEGDSKILDLLHLDSETGEIVVANRIDHETYQWLNFSVKATDSGYPSRSSLVDVFINVLDENDNNPYFLTSTKNFSISENSAIGTRVGVIQAHDADSGDYGKITFLMDRISSQGKFSIDADTGVLSVSEKLDRETKDLYVLVIEAWDNYQFGYIAGESRNAFKQVFVNVLDENDSPPEITLPSGCVQITEYHDLRETIATIRGKDADDPNLPNGKIEFSISKGNEDGLFRITQSDPWTAQILANKLLKNKYGNYSLIISARDLGVPSNYVKNTLNICVADFNDHPPVFVSPPHNTTVRVPENTTVGSVIIQVHATDDDVGINAAVKYRLKPDSLGNYRTFDIDKETGEIILKKELNREMQKIYEIRVEAYDQGIPTSLSSDLELMIYVRNVNEYEPQFLVEEITLNFTEHNPPGQEKIKLPDTIDRDEVDELDDPPSNVCYYIIHGNENDLFYLDPITHILQVEKELDRELKSNHTLYVRATENCSSDNIKNMTIDNDIAEKNHGISSANDRSDTMDIFYNSNRKIGNNKYTNLFNRYKYSRNIRNIIENGDIHSFNSAQFNDEHLMADSTIVRVQIRVMDINDNPPKFIARIFTGGITTNADFGIKFMQIQAIDPDEGKNAEITYHQIGEIKQTLSEGLENVGDKPFIVDEKTGFIQLNFDPQKGMKGYFDFMALAKDKDNLQDTAHVFIYLLREDQKVKFVFRQQPPILRDKINSFRQFLSNITNAIVNIDEFKVHENKDGSVDKTKTDLYLHLVDRKDNSILDVSDVLKLIDEHIDELDELFKEFNVLDTQPAESQLLMISNIGKGSMYIWLIFSNIFITILLVVTIALCISQRTNYKRQLRAAKVNIYSVPSSDIVGRDPLSTVPNTNKHSVEGSNPIWLRAYDNEWFKNDDDLSQNGPDSLDDNCLGVENTATYINKKLFDQPNDLNRHFNVYHQIDKLAGNAELLVKKLETTEL